MLFFFRFLCESDTLKCRNFMANIQKKNTSKNKKKNMQTENVERGSDKGDGSDGHVVTWKEIRKSDGREAIMTLTLTMTI